MFSSLLHKGTQKGTYAHRADTHRAEHHGGKIHFTDEREAEMYLLIKYSELTKQIVTVRFKMVRYT